MWRNVEFLKDNWQPLSVKRWMTSWLQINRKRCTCNVLCSRVDSALFKHVCFHFRYEIAEATAIFGPSRSMNLKKLLPTTCVTVQYIRALLCLCPHVRDNFKQFPETVVAAGRQWNSAGIYNFIRMFYTQNNISFTAPIFTNSTHLLSHSRTWPLATSCPVIRNIATRPEMKV